MTVKYTKKVPTQTNIESVNNFCRIIRKIFVEISKESYNLKNNPICLSFIHSWYVGDMSRQRAESLLKQNDKEGCFVVRKSSTKGLYTLSLHTKVPQSHVKHYHIKQNGRAEFYLSEKHCCETIPDLINYHRHNSGGLACRLKCSPCDRPVPPTAGLSHGE
jgi:SH2 domain